MILIYLIAILLAGAFTCLDNRKMESTVASYHFTCCFVVDLILIMLYIC